MKVLVTTACMAVLPAIAMAQQAPSPAQLQANVTNKIGNFWSSEKFTIVATKAAQDPMKPTYTIRFEMDATNPAALYAPNGDKIGPQQIVVMTVPAKTARTFYGTEQLAYSAGNWTGTTDIENPADKLGKPLDFYTVPTLVLGSDQYKQALAQQTAFSLDQRKALFQKQLDALQATETAKLDDLQKAFAASLKATEDATSAQLSNQQTQIATLQTADAAKLSDIEKAFQAGLQKLNTEFGDKLKLQQAALTGELSAELSKSQQALADEQNKVEAARAGLISQQQDTLAKLKLGLQNTQDAVAAKIKLAQATLTSQNQLIALQKQVLANNLTIVSLKSKLAEKFKAQLVSFEGTWAGSLRCGGTGPSHWGIGATQMEMTLSKQAAGMLTGQLTVTGGDIGTNYYGKMPENKPIPASLQIMNVDGKGAPQLNVLTTPIAKDATEKSFLNFEVQLDPAGTLKGDAVHWPKDCSVTFSR